MTAQYQEMNNWISAKQLDEAMQKIRKLRIVLTRLISAEGSGAEKHGGAGMHGRRALTYAVQIQRR